MPRPLRVEYEGACYHVTSRGDRREPIFVDDQDRERFILTLAQACAKTLWQVHAWCLMTNHFHAVIETPQPNLGAGMKWLLGAYTQRFNRRHRHWGHLFGGRYKAQLVDERSPSYLVAACDYVHLNPVRAGMLETDAPLHSYRWSSYPAYLQVKLRQPWLRVDRVLGGHGLADGTARHRREFSRRMEQRRIDPQDTPELRQGWKVGAEDFADWLADKLSRPGRAGERARERNETDKARAERLVLLGLDEIGWSETELIETGKAHPMKITLAKRLRAETPMTRRWIANRLQMGSPSYLSALLCSYNSKL